MSETNRPNAKKLLETRKGDKLHSFSEKQLEGIEEKAKREDKIINARKSLNKMAGSYPSGDTDDEGNDLSIDEKIKQVKKGKEFPYNIPILGGIFQSIKLAILRSKKNKIKEQILNEIENETISENNKNAIGQENVYVLKDSDVKNQIRGEIAAENAKDQKIINDYGKIVRPAINYAAGKGLINSDQKANMDNELKKSGVDIPESNQALTEAQWEILKKVAEKYEKEEQDKSKSENAEKKQEGQAKEENTVNKPNPEELKKDKANQTQGQQTQVTPAVMQQKIGSQKPQTQAVAQTAQTQNVQTQNKGTGLQIGSVGKTTQGTTVSSGATGVGTVKGKSGPQI